MSLASAPARSPIDGQTRPMLDKTRPTGWHPLGMLMPAQHGNPSRQFLSQDSYELTIANKFVFPSLLSFSVLSTNTNVLTSRCWPKIKLPEGVQQVGGQEMTYNVIPTTSVPKRGTVRYMSKQLKSWSGAIAQKGIGSEYEGSALNTEYGPQLIAMDIRAYAESIDQGMAINTAINMVNAAHRAPYIKNGMVFARNVTQEISNELGHWACIGLNQGRISREVENKLVDAPNLNTMLVPDKSGDYMGYGIGGQEIDIIIYTISEDRQLLRAKSPDKLIAKASFGSGRVPVFEMTTFKLKNSGKTFQPLEAVNQIGEVYFMFPEQHPGRPGYYHPSMWDLYLYDQPRDAHTKVTGVEAVIESNIWNKSSPNYSDLLLRYMDLANSRKTNLDLNKLQQYPISRDTSNGSLYAPLFMGNLDEGFMDMTGLNNSVESIINLLSYNGDGGKISLADASDRLKNIDRLREIIERESYNPAYWAEVARLNIGRSLAWDSNRPVFVGSPTPDARVRSYSMSAPITEWTANPFGGMDIPVDMEKFGKPAGMFSAAGINTMRNMHNHPLNKLAAEVYNTLSMIGEGVRNVIKSSTIFSPDEMPVNLPVTDVVQHVLTALYGPRVPVFLAAPDNLVRETQTEQTVPDQADAFHVGYVDTTAETSEVVPGLMVGVEGAVRNVLIARNDPIQAIHELRGLLDQTDNAFRRVDDHHRALFGRWLAARLRSAVLEKKRPTIEILAKTYVYLDGLSAEEATKAISVIIRGKKTEDSATIDDEVNSINVRLKEKAIEKLAAAYAGDSEGIKGASPQLVDKYYALVAILQAIYQQAPDAFKGKATLKLTNEKDATVLDVGAAETVSAELKTNFADALVEFNAARGNLLAVVTLNAIGKKGSGAGAASPIATVTTQDGLSGARFFRTPMFFSYALLTSLGRHKSTWILPGDPALNFSAHLPNNSLIAQNALNMPHYVQSRAGEIDKVSSWSNVSIFARMALVSKAFATARPQSAEYGSDAFSLNTMSSGPIGDAIGDAFGDPRRPRIDAMDVDGPASSSPQINPKWLGVVRGPMMRRIQWAMDTYAHKPVHRFAALAFLTVPHQSLLAVTQMVAKGLSLPFEIWLWRLFSRHMMGSFLLLEAGLNSGANFYNGAKFTVSHDGETDVVHTRAVITTDPLVINPQNHHLIRNVVPRLYLGQHNCSFIRNADDTSEDKPTMMRPSIISTIVPSGQHNRVRVPLSFIDAVPGQVIPGSKETLVVDPVGQHFPGANFYGHFVYASLFEGHKAMKNFSSTPVSEDLVFAGDNKVNNHIAFIGHHIRFDYNNGYFTHEVAGNGHRANRRLNFPGAKDYLNGSGTYLMEPLPVAQYNYH